MAMADGKATTADSEANDTYRDESSTITKTPSVIHIVIGVSAKSTPADVLTPFPPLNPAHSGYMWPATAAIPAIRRTTVSICQTSMPEGSESRRIEAITPAANKPLRSEEHTSE